MRRGTAVLVCAQVRGDGPGGALCGACAPLAAPCCDVPRLPRNSAVCQISQVRRGFSYAWKAGMRGVPMHPTDRLARL